MKKTLLNIPPIRKLRHEVQRVSKFGLALAQAVLLGLGATVSSGQETEAATDDQGAQVLTRGPIHEAFAGMVSYNPEPGVVVDRAPPEIIEELPPSERPEGDNISWIPGYWAWDDERTDYLWVSGTWRALPPGREWTTGYWGEAEGGHQWTSGYWADSTERETVYLPKPPATVEVGANIKAPSKDHFWSPGSWMWEQERYAWSPGYWAEGRSNWDWTPAHYVWTPRGYVYVDGYWDYSMNRRGTLYAPVHFRSGYSSRPGYQYSPVIAIGLAALVDHLFLRPTYHHYYFGDYYDRRYSTRGYYSPFAYQSRRYGYDPVYSYQRWSHRQDNDWERKHQASYDYRRDNESARPPRTWSDQRSLNMDRIEAKDRQSYLMAAPLDEMAKQPDRQIRVQKVSADERQQLTAQSREVRKNRDQRRALESEGVKRTDENSERKMKPIKVKRSASPIVGKSSDQFAEAQAPPKPLGDSKSDRIKDPSDNKKNPDKARDETKKDRPTIPGEEDPKTKGSDRKVDPDKGRDETKKDLKAPRREGDPKTKDSDPMPKPDKDRPETKQDQPPPRREVEPKTKDSDRKLDLNKGRDETKKDRPSSRREVEPKTKESDSMPKPDRDRPETKQDQPPPRRDVDAKAKNTERKEATQRKEAAPDRAREQRKPKAADDREKETQRPSGKKSKPDKSDKESLGEEKAKQ